MRIIMIGTGPFAVPTFHALLASSHHVVSLITQPIRLRKGRRVAAPSPMRDAAIARHVPVHDPESINSPEGLAILVEFAAELLIVCDFGQILKPDVLASARLGAINLHGSLLPNYRGAAPVQWALLNGEQTTGVTVFQITPGLDAGPILTQRSVAIEPEENGQQLETRLSEIGAGAVLEAIDMLASWDGMSALGRPQDASLATRAPRLKKEDGHIDWRASAKAVSDRVRALAPWPGTYAIWDGGVAEPLRLLIKAVSLPDAMGRSEAGQVVIADEHRLWIQAGDGQVVSIERIQPAGKAEMPVAAFLRGHRIQAGDRLT